MTTSPDCYQCKFRGSLPGDAHSRCTNPDATVVGDSHGIANGWFFWPFSFDPCWLRGCDGFKDKTAGVAATPA